MAMEVWLWKYSYESMVTNESIEGKQFASHRHGRGCGQTRGGVEWLESPKIMSQYHTFTHKILPSNPATLFRIRGRFWMIWRGGGGERLVWSDRPFTY